MARKIDIFLGKNLHKTALDTQLSSLYPNNSLLPDHDLTLLLKQNCKIKEEMQSFPLLAQQLKLLLETLGVKLPDPEVGTLHQCMSLVGDPVTMNVVCVWANRFKQLPEQSLFSVDLQQVDKRPTQAMPSVHVFLMKLYRRYGRKHL